MKVVQLNAVCSSGSTGVIAAEISKVLNENSIENYILYTSGNSSLKESIKYSNKLLVKSAALMSKLKGNYGFNSHIATKKLLRMLDEIKPDIVHLHNIHGHDLDLDIFFKYLKNKELRVIWTFHDCWAFTGYCTHYITADCFKWQTGCEGCPKKRAYSFFLDRSKKLYAKKKELISGIEQLEIVVPSEWMANSVSRSFLKDKKIYVINNGIDLSIFQPRKSDFRSKQGIGNKKMLLGIPKGNMKYFNELSKMLTDDQKLVLVGLTQDEINALPEEVVGIPYTRSREELAEIYSAADVFINMSMADTFPTVNIEALACGTPVVTFRTGGSPEIIDEDTGIVVEQENVAAINEAVQKICTGSDRSGACIERARRLYNAKERFNDYYELYCRTGRFK